MTNKLLTAKWDTKSNISQLDHNKILDYGIKFLLIDVDGTLLPRIESRIHPSIMKWINHSKKYFSIHLISNNPSKERIGNIAKQLDLTFTYRANKPGRTSIKNYIKTKSCKAREIAIIGDRIFTDVLAGNRLGIFTILVKPIDLDGQSIENNTLLIIERKIAKLFGA